MAGTTTGCMGGMVGMGSFRPIGGAPKGKKKHGNTSNISGSTGMMGMKVIKPTKQAVVMKKKK